MTRKLCLVMVLALIALPLAAKTPDGETPAEETICDTEGGAAFGLCNAYCEAMDCDLANDGDPSTNPNADLRACTRVRQNFFKQTGRDLPCEMAIECPCFDPNNWFDPGFGEIWKDFADGLSVPDACTENAAITKLTQGVGFEFVAAAVDPVLFECQVFEFDDLVPAATLAIDPAEVEPCRDLLRDAAAMAGVVCTP